MKKRTVFTVILVTTLIWILFVATMLSCFGAEVKNNSSSKELQIRKQKFEQCIKNGTPRSQCRYLYY